MYKWMNRRMDGWMDGMNKWMKIKEEEMDGWMDGWIDELMTEWTDER